LVEIDSKEKFCNTAKLEDGLYVKEIRPTVPLMAESFTNTFNLFALCLF